MLQSWANESQPTPTRGLLDLSQFLFQQSGLSSLLHVSCLTKKSGAVAAETCVPAVASHFLVQHLKHLKPGSFSTKPLTIDNVICIFG